MDLAAKTVTRGKCIWGYVHGHLQLVWVESREGAVIDILGHSFIPVV